MGKSNQPGLVSARSVRVAVVPALVAFVFFGLVYHFAFDGRWGPSFGFALFMGLVVFAVYAMVFRRR